MVENSLQLKTFFKALWCGTLLPIHRAFFIHKNMNMEILFTRPVTEDSATVIKLIKFDTGISITVGNIEFTKRFIETENYHFIENDNIDEFIGALTFLKSII